jgi:ABC-type transporter Mla subunit MlaD
MSRRANPVAIGAFVVGALALVVIGLIVFGGVSLLHRPLHVVMYFDESVNGLSVGAPVSYRGVKVGAVTAIEAQVGTTRIAVFADLEPGTLAKHPTQREARDELVKAIQSGLRAQLAMQSIVTGQIYVSLVILPESVPITVGLDPSLVEIPTVPTLFQQFVDRVEKVVSAVQDLPWDRLFQAGLETLEGARDLARSPELQRTLRSADAALADFQKLVNSMQREVGPLIVSLRGTSDATRNAMTGVGTDLQQVLAETRPLIASLKDTSDATRAGVTDVAGDFRKTLGDLRPLVAKLEEASDAARVALERSQTVLGDASATFDSESGLGYQLAQTLRELTTAARSLRALTDYFQQHPDAILFGRGRPAAQ